MEGSFDLHVSCSHNPLKELPSHLSSLQQLKVLDVSGMKLAHLPEEIAALQNLVKLLCQGNALSFLPERLGMLQRRLQYVSPSIVQDAYDTSYLC